MAADAYAGQVGSTTTPGKPDNIAPADRADFDPSAFSAQPGSASRANGFPRAL